MKLNYRTVVFALAIVFGVFFSMPSLMQMEDGKKVNLNGKDLKMSFPANKIKTRLSAGIVISIFSLFL